MKISAVVPDKLGIALEDDRWPSGTTRVRGSPDQGIPEASQRPNMTVLGGFVASRPKGEQHMKSLVTALVTVVVLALSATALADPSSPDNGCHGYYTTLYKQDVGDRGGQGS